MKTNIPIVLFTNTCCAIFNGPNRWHKDWMTTGKKHFCRLRHQQVKDSVGL